MKLTTLPLIKNIKKRNERSRHNTRYRISSCEGSDSNSTWIVKSEWDEFWLKTGALWQMLMSYEKHRCLILARKDSSPKRFPGLAKLYGHSWGDEWGRKELSSTSGGSNWPNVRKEGSKPPEYGKLAQPPEYGILATEEAGRSSGRSMEVGSKRIGAKGSSSGPTSDVKMSSTERQR